MKSVSETKANEEKYNVSIIEESDSNQLILASKGNNINRNENQ